MTNVKTVLKRDRAARIRQGRAWLLCGLLGLGGVAAQAQSMAVTGISRTGCVSSGFGFDVTFAGLAVPTGPWRFRTVVNQGPNIFMDQIFPAPPSAGINFADGPSVWSVFDANQGGTVNTVFPMPDNVPFTMTVSIIEPGGAVASSSTTTVDRCGAGAQIVPTAAVAVPTLGAGGLAALSGLLGVMGWARRRRAAGALA